MDFLFSPTGDGAIQFLHQTHPVASDAEAFDSQSKLVSTECAARNSVLALLLFSLGHTHARALFLDSCSNLTAFYLHASAAALKIPISSAVVSNSVSWNKRTLLSIEQRLLSFKSLQSALDQARTNVVFLDSCSCFITIIDSIFTSFSTLSRHGGVWGLSWTNARHSPTWKNLRSHPDSHVKAIINGIGGYFNPNDGVSSYDWVMNYCRQAAARAGFQLQLVWSDRQSNHVCTAIFQARPLDQSAPLVATYSSMEAIYRFWTCPEIQPLLALHNGLLYSEYLQPLFQNCIADFPDDPWISKFSTHFPNLQQGSDIMEHFLIGKTGTTIHAGLCTQAHRLKVVHTKRTGSFPTRPVPDKQGKLTFCSSCFPDRPPTVVAAPAPVPATPFVIGSSKIMHCSHCRAYKRAESCAGGSDVITRPVNVNSPSFKRCQYCWPELVKQKQDNNDKNDQEEDQNDEEQEDIFTDDNDSEPRAPTVSGKRLREVEVEHVQEKTKVGKKVEDEAWGFSAKLGSKEKPFIVHALTAQELAVKVEAAQEFLRSSIANHREMARDMLQYLAQ